MKTFVIFRHGLNAANQSMTHAMAVAIVEAKDKHEAIQVALDTVKLYANQYLEARFASRCKQSEIEEAQQVMEARQEHLAHINDLVEYYSN
jgi:hypothetical protein